MSEPATRFDADLGALAFLVDAGLDVIVGDAPVNRLAPPPPVAGVVREPPHAPATMHAGAAGAPSEREVADSAAPIAARCTTLVELRQALEGFDGLAIRETATQLVFADGNPDAKIMIVGEAPGRDEDRLGKPFVGESGKLLDRMLAAIGLDRSSVYITNTILWRPPGNRKPTPAEVDAMLPFLRRHIDLVAPKAMLLAGGSALSALFGFEARITREHGKWREYPAAHGPVPVLPLFHPAYLLRQPSLKREAWADLLAFRAKLDELGL